MTRPALLRSGDSRRRPGVPAAGCSRRRDHAEVQRKGNKSDRLRVVGPSDDPESVLAAWDAWQVVGGKAERTRTERARVVRQVWLATGEHPLTFTSDALLVWLGSIPKDSTRLSYFRVLQAFSRWLQTTGRRADDPTLGLPKPKEPKRKPHPTATGGLERLLTSGIRRRTQAMVLLKCYSGLRVHEVAKVRGEDIDLDGGCIRVEGKGGTVRWLPLHPAIEALAQDFPRSGWWFESYKYPGRPMRRDTASSTISRAMKRAGIQGTAHSIRHWFGTEALANGANLRVTQELMRHESVATTQGYTEVTMEQMRAAVLRLPSLGGDR